MDTYPFHPDFIWNADETMISIADNQSKVIVFNDSPPPTRAIPSRLEHITLMLAGSASGYPLQPFAILPLKTMPDLPDHLLTRYKFYVGNSSGWQTEESLITWLFFHFVPHIQRMREIHGNDQPALLVLDGHSSRNNLNLKQLWDDHKVAITLIPPNTSHLLQPMDLSVNSTLKLELGKKFKFIPI